ncbi:hypothetical protein [Nocardioides sp. CFH 31398]|nr:hypothetical protein [Nocardioides sp. CFH 31398]
MSPEDREYLEESCAASGVDLKIKDREALADLALLLRGGAERG